MAKESKPPASSDLSGPSPQVLESRLKMWLPDLTAPELSQLSLIYTELRTVNRAHVLVPAATLAIADSALFFDSVRAARLILPEIIKDQPVCDVGGATGFPGLTFSILYPSIKVQIFERDARKAEFLRKIIVACGLKNASVVIGDLEHLPAGSLFNAIFRASPTLTKTLISARKATASAGRLFHIKGDAWSGELASLPPQLFSFWQAKLIGSYKLPADQAPVNIVMTQKLAD